MKITPVPDKIRKLASPIRAEIEYMFRQPNRILFDHLPKCAGTAIINYLLDYYPRRCAFTVDGQRPKDSIRLFESKSQRERYGYRLVAGHLTHSLLNLVHPDTIAVTVFREPLDRVVSEYFYVIQEKGHWLHDELIRSGTGLEGYASIQVKHGINNFFTKHFSELSEADICRSPQDAVQQALNCINRNYQIIGFQDDLSATTDQLHNLLNLRKRFGNEIRNKTISRLSTGEISPHARDELSRVNSADIELYSLLRQMHRPEERQGKAELAKADTA